MSGIEVIHVTVSSTPVARFDGTMYAHMDHEVPVWTTDSNMIGAGRPCTNVGRRQSPALLHPRPRHAAVQPPQPAAVQPPQPAAVQPPQPAAVQPPQPAAVQPPQAFP